MVTHISDAELKARILDLLWIKKKNYRFAIAAIDSYIESSQILEDPEHWWLSFIRIRRAVDIAASIGKNTEYFENAVKHVETIITKYHGEDPKFLSLYLMELLQEYKKGDVEHYISLSEKIALKAESDHYRQKAAHAWKTMAKWHELAKDKDKERLALKNLAESYVKYAEDDINKTPPNYLNASEHIDNAIQEYRKIGNERKRIEELHTLLLEYQSKSVSQMIQMPIEFSIPAEEINKAKEFVRGKTLQDAIFALASITCSPEISKLRCEVEKISTEYPISHLFLRKIVNEQGKQIYKTGPLLSGNPDEKEKNIQDEMFKHAKNHHLFLVAGIIEPARHQIVQEHSVIQVEDLLQLVSINPFVPPGRELIYASGLYAGLIGDFLTSIHLLIPQLENSIRYVLNNNGIITSGFNQSGIQNEDDLNSILKIEELNKIIPEEIVFDLRGLLIERNGSNLRNRMAHGLIDYNEYKNSLEVRYLWWLTLNLCGLWKFVSRQSNEEETKC